MDHENGSRTSVLSEWMGYWVFISYLSGPSADPEEPSKAIKGEPEARTATFLLEQYGAHGVEVKPSREHPTVFMSWGAVLTVQGPPPEAREEIDREVARRTGEEDS